MGHLDKIKIDDAASPVGDISWLERPLASCLLYSDVESCWSKLEQVYHNEFKGMVFGRLPSSEDILQTLSFLQTRLIEYDAQGGML